MTSTFSAEPEKRSAKEHGGCFTVGGVGGSE